MSSLPLPIEIVRTDDALERVAARWRCARELAIDTEFVRERTFFPHLGLIQVADESAATLVDPLAVRDLDPFAAVLDAPGIVKVVHSASQDLEVFYRTFGRLPVALFDTQEAAAIAGVGPGIGYGRLVHERLGVELEKGETRTDWLARPLSEAQLTYAAADVAYLLPIYRSLAAELEDKGRFAWALEDSASLLEARFDDEPEEAHRRIKGAGRFDGRQLAAVRALAAWREREARRRDLPRNQVLREELLLELARRRPVDAKDFAKLPGFQPRQAARDGERWLALLGEVAALPAEALPPVVERRKPAPEVERLEDDLRQRVRERAAALGLAPETLASRRPLAALARALEQEGEPTLPRELEGWRREVVGDELLALVAERRRALAGARSGSSQGEASSA